ncbi:MAG: UDP-N-acetylmuramoyl-L-alanine--D-glutamate ligase [Firmicutes bacterium]|nr:UDP-N-acetylmuramoyl-L-alanine--D-glutamate ligase [Bacillota bacterium]
MKFKDKKVLVLGAGSSGISAAIFLLQQRAQVTIYDDKKIMDAPEGAVIEYVQHNLEPSDFDLCVLSPGVSVNHSLAQKFASKIASEVALGFTSRHRKKVGVTGTNGKTTVVEMITDAINFDKSLFKKGAILCGNSGIPVTSVRRQIKKRIPVTEVSSFMLEPQVEYKNNLYSKKFLRSFAFRPYIGVVLNITEDHLERHGTMENYFKHKASITAFQKRRDKLVLNFDCENSREISKQTKARVYYFSSQARVRGVFLEDGVIYSNITRRIKPLFRLRDTLESKPHQVQNILATTLVCKLLGTSTNAIIGACTTREIPHKIQFVAAKGGTAFYNDSKATNVASCLSSIKCFQLPIHLLVGGMPKGQDFSQLFLNIQPHVKKIFAFGEAKEEIQKAARKHGYAFITTYENLLDATREAAKGMGQKVVLLSPACSSFDQFTSYADRGEKFIQIVKELIEEKND